MMSISVAAATLLQRGKAELGVQLDGLGHLADVERVGAHLVHDHDDPPDVHERAAGAAQG